MTPIFVRPVREQLEHDRLIRFLLARLGAKRKLDVLANIGEEHQAPVKVGNNVYYPDLVVLDGKRVTTLIEVETSESTNNLEAMAQWTHFSRARVPFHLYVPVLAVDAARRLCDANQVFASEIWSYRPVNDQFDLVRVLVNPDAVKASSKGSKAASLPVVLPPPKPKPLIPPVPVAAPPVPEKPVVAAPKPAGGASKAVAPPTKPAANAKAPAKAAPKSKPAPKAKPNPKAKPKATAKPKAKAKPRPVKAKPRVGAKKK